MEEKIGDADLVLNIKSGLLVAVTWVLEDSTCTTYNVHVPIK